MLFAYFIFTQGQRPFEVAVWFIHANDEVLIWLFMRFTQRVRCSSASGSSLTSLRLSNLILSLGLWFHAKSTASGKVVTSRSYRPTSFLKFIWRNYITVQSLSRLLSVRDTAVVLIMLLDVRGCQCCFLERWFLFVNVFYPQVTKTMSLLFNYALAFRILTESATRGINKLLTACL